MNAAVPTWPLWSSFFDAPRDPNKQIEIVDVYRDPLDGRRLVIQFDGSVSDKEVADVKRTITGR